MRVLLDDRATDASLVAAVAGGDADALAVLFRRHAPWITARLTRRCADAELVDLALHDTFISVWRSAAGYRGTGEVGAWLWSIAIRRLIDQLRRRRPVPVEHVPEQPLPPPAPGIELHDLLGRLPADLQATVEAVHLDQLTTAEAALLLGIPQGTVKSRLHRARALLARQLPGDLR